MYRNSFFKKIFWILTGIIGMLMLGLLVGAGIGMIKDPDFPMQMLGAIGFISVLIAAMITAISVFVYKDATKRGMDPWLWMTIAVFVPNLIGLIIYIIARKNNDHFDAACIACHRPVRHDYNLCPYCGAKLHTPCPQCGKEVSGEWNLCPYCSKKLKIE